MNLWRISLCLVVGLLASTGALAQSAEPDTKTGASSSQSPTKPKAVSEKKSKAERREAHRRLRMAQRHRVK
jgi:hypothetical protein